MAKAPNYTEEQTKIMRRMYIDVSSESEARRAEVVQEIATMFNKSPASVRAKLSRENVYIAKKPVAKDGNPAMSKDVLAGILSISAGVPLVSAEKLNKDDLKRLINAFEELRDQIADLEIED